MRAPGRFIAWSKQEQSTLQQQLELLESGKVRTGEDQGDGWVDTTDQSIKRIKKRLAELEELLTEAGSGTASKPGER
jgi:flagellin-like hook-associated protein FlgL